MNTTYNSVEGTAKRLNRLDWYAATLSTLCLVHCLALPLFASMLPLAGQLSENALIHRGLVLLTAPATLWVAWQIGYTSRTRPFIIPAFVGLALLLLAAFVEVLSPFEQTMTLMGSVLVASAHLWRWFHGRHAASQQHLMDKRPGG